MQASLFRSLARSLATLALGLSIATTPAVAGLRVGGGGGFHGAGGGFHGGFGGGGFHAGFGGGGFHGGLGDEGFHGGFGDGGFRFGDRGFRGRFADRGFRRRFATDTSMEASTPFTPVMAIAATAPAITDTPATATALLASPARNYGDVELIAARGAHSNHIQIVRRAAG
jgi:hypothetical protein